MIASVKYGTPLFISKYGTIPYFKELLATLLVGAIREGAFGFNHDEWGYQQELDVIPSQLMGSAMCLSPPLSEISSNIRQLKCVN